MRCRSLYIQVHQSSSRIISLFSRIILNICKYQEFMCLVCKFHVAAIRAISLVGLSTSHPLLCIHVSHIFLSAAGTA